MYAVTVETSRRGQARHTNFLRYRRNPNNVYVYNSTVLVSGDPLRSSYGDIY